jgi:hypothetical protein
MTTPLHYHAEKKAQPASQTSNLVLKILHMKEKVASAATRDAATRDAAIRDAATEEVTGDDNFFL